MTVETLTADLAARIRALPGRSMTAIAGPPASGKSTLAEAVVAALGSSATLLPMDGFHLDDRILEPLGLRHRKGAPETFDAEGFARAAAAIRAVRDVYVPVFDRTREIAIAGAQLIPAGAAHVVAEGNWLLLDAEPWRGIDWDLTVRLDAPDDVLRARLMARWSALPETEARAKTEGNDLPNALRVRTGSRQADLVINA